MLHSKTLNIVKVGMVMVTLLSSAFAEQTFKSEVDVVFRTEGESRLPKFVERTDKPFNQFDQMLNIVSLQ